MGISSLPKSLNESCTDQKRRHCYLCLFPLEKPELSSTYRTVLLFWAIDGHSLWPTLMRYQIVQNMSLGYVDTDPLEMSHLDQEPLWECSAVLVWYPRQCLTMILWSNWRSNPLIDNTWTLAFGDRVTYYMMMVNSLRCKSKLTDNNDCSAHCLSININLCKNILF